MDLELEVLRSRARIVMGMLTWALALARVCELDRVGARRTPHQGAGVGNALGPGFQRSV